MSYKMDLKEVKKVFISFLNSQINNGMLEDDAALLFGTKYALFLKNNKIDLDELLYGLPFDDKDKVLNSLSKGIELSPYLIWRGIDEANEQDEDNELTPIIINNREKGAFNKIFYGAPGCGKSRYISDMLKDINVIDKNLIRVTFHPEYANCDFVGQIIPTIEEKIDDKTGEVVETVKYIFNPGPLTLALQTAYNTEKMVYFVIEEINRGNAAGIFGDMFQLLDRLKDDSEDFGESEYPVSNPNMQKYLIANAYDETIKEKLNNGVFIPSNLTILATMNTSDQNVFTLDTAFKRRWLFEQISNDIKLDTKHAYKNWHIPGEDVTWETFVTVINDKILEYKIQNQTNEDKRLGKYFVGRECLTENVEDIDAVQDKAKIFAYKVLEYIWNDVCKIGREDWFDTQKNKTLEDLINSFVSPASGKTPLSIFESIAF